MAEEHEVDSVFLRRVYQGLAAGNAQARDELLLKVQARLERLARKMLRDFPGVRRWEDTGDVLQHALIRLLRALDEVRPESERAFFGLAAEQIRRVLLDLVRHYKGVYGLGTHHASVTGLKPAGQDTLAPALDPPASDVGTDLDRWCAFHEAIERLEATEREVFSLSFYHGWTQVEIAALLQVNERTVRRYWNAACLKLHELLGGELPTL